MQLESLLFVIRVKVAYISYKPPLVGEHAFPMTEFVGWLAHVTQEKCEKIPIDCMLGQSDKVSFSVEHRYVM